MKRDRKAAERIELALRYMRTRTVEPLTLRQLHAVIGGGRRAFYRLMHAALRHPASGICVVIEDRRARGGSRRVWSLRQAVDAGMHVVLGPEALDA